MVRLLPRVYPICDTAALRERGRDPLWFAEALLEGGARILQLRHKGHYSRAVFESARKLAELCRQAGCTLVINDRSDIARLLDAGLHLGQSDLEPELARRITGPETLIGFSTHNAAQLRAGDAEPVDYLALGPLFATASKPDADAVVGLEALARLRSLSSKPLVAIGGITAERASAVWRAGADSIAVIGDLMPDDFTRLTIRERLEQWLKM